MKSDPNIPVPSNEDVSQLSDQLDDLLPEFVRLVMDRLLAEPSSATPSPAMSKSVQSNSQTASADWPAVTPSQAYLLRQLAVRGPCTAAEIGRILGITSGPVTSITQRLVNRGLLERRQDERDRRIMHFSLTTLGEDMLQVIHERMRSRWTLLLERLGTDKSAELLSLLQEATAILQSWPN